MNLQLTFRGSNPSVSTLSSFFQSLSSHPIPAPSSSSSPFTLPLPPSSVLEIHGRSNSGKTSFLYHHALRTALPPHLGGEGLSSVVIDCDGRFRAERILELIDAAWRRQWKESATQGNAGEEGEGSERWMNGRQSLRREVLSRIRIIRAHSPVELMVALKLVERMWEEEQPAQAGHLAPRSAVKDEQRQTAMVGAYMHSKQRPSFHSPEEILLDAAVDRPLLSHAVAISALPLPSSPAERVSCHSPPPGCASPPPPVGRSLSLLLLDNVAALHWTTKPSAGTPSSQASFASLLSSSLHRLLQRTGLRCVVTKPILFRSAGDALQREWQHAEFMGESYASLVRFRLLLRCTEAGHEGRLVACREEERNGRRMQKGSILDQRAFVSTAEGIVFL